MKRFFGCLKVEMAAFKKNHKGFFYNYLRALIGGMIDTHSVDGEIVGFLIINDNEIGRIGVKPKYQKKGIGSILIKRNLRKIKSVIIRHENRKAKKFYEKFGFRVDEIKRNKIKMIRE